jgi:hypothetical protein
VQLVVCEGEGVGRRGGFAGQGAELHPLWLPLLGGEQDRRRIGVPARAGHVHVPGAQTITQPISTHNSQ